MSGSINGSESVAISSTIFMVTTARAYQDPFSNTAVVATAGIIFPLLVLGIFGNVVTIVVITSSKKLRSVFNQFILSLCVSDLVSAVISPLYWYRRTWGYGEWKISSFLCKMYWAIDICTSYVTALHILLFAILRLISVRWPHHYMKIKLKHARIIIPSLWLIAFSIGFIPFTVWYDAVKRRRNTADIDAGWPSCSLLADKTKQYGLYSLAAFSIFFYLPIVLIFVLTLAIGILLARRRRERRQKLRGKLKASTENSLKKDASKEREAMVQLAMIVGSFMLGYVPFSAYEISSSFIPTLTAADERFWWRFGVAGYVCLRFSESLNPVFYNLASPKLRRHTIRCFVALKEIIINRSCKRNQSSSISGSSTADGGLHAVNT